ncbi:uncharacterized protein F4807DRAFT_461756 [Annulohypoxylon truncatum]|uniref:uncharacterized protein n=1 Tax=Annulohypoxylon truncatum TaxID=327061 RepID=UPI00200832C4|nr:uncharacterized protein F4807DRAFT_461756 [Annulohypoxylon truncatum]KAI1208429.1 hypothetical protein F4807DRAFT_461756 [Annulohypoxylon truncatum]
MNPLAPRHPFAPRNPFAPRDPFAGLPDEDQVGKPCPDFKRPRQPSLSPRNVIKCLVCEREVTSAYFVQLSCRHAHCVECVWENAHMAYLSKPFAPAKCCRVIPIEIFVEIAAFSKNEIKTYINRLEEYSTPGRKLYCHDQDCLGFIPEASCSQRVGTCPKCGKNTCKTCAQKSHFGNCDPAHINALGPDDPVLKLANAEGWKQCPNCRILVERNSGCTHMTASVTCAASRWETIPSITTATSALKSLVDL